MDLVVLDQFPYRISSRRLAATLRLPDSSPYIGELRGLIEEAQVVARPKAAYRMAFIEAREPDAVIIDGVRFRSRVLRVNLDRTERVFLYVATCGVELEEWSRAQSDTVRAFWADAIKEAAVREAVRVLRRHIVRSYGLKRIAMMAPGSLHDWPIHQQRLLFSAMGDVKGAIGVELSPSLLMKPTKSVSGILFPNEESFESCQLCPRPSCPSRRAPYDDELFERKYRLS